VATPENDRLHIYSLWYPRRVVKFRDIQCCKLYKGEGLQKDSNDSKGGNIVVTVVHDGYKQWSLSIQDYSRFEKPVSFLITCSRSAAGAATTATRVPRPLHLGDPQVLGNLVDDLFAEFACDYPLLLLLRPRTCAALQRGMDSCSCCCCEWHRRSRNFVSQVW
jgi:hypothetical protein